MNNIQFHILKGHMKRYLLMSMNIENDYASSKN